MRLNGARALVDTIETIRETLHFDAPWVVGTNVEYAVFVEFGTSRNVAQPYLRPAVRKVQRRIDDVVAGAQNVNQAIALIAKAIEAEAKRLCPVDTGRLRSSITAERL